jgi:glycosyltransferase involved in cell wall biosynthesis
MKSVSVIVPAYNEAECVEELITRLQKVFESIPKYNFELIIVENGSTDNTLNLALLHKNNDDRIKIIKLSRNFGMDGGLSAGLDFINSDACVLMTADLQDPPEFIGQLIELWEQGYENIYGLISKRTGTKFLRKLNSQIFYWIASKFSDGKIPRNVSDFRLLDRKVYESVRKMPEKNKFMRGLSAWVGYKSIGINIERPPRFAGNSKAYSLLIIDFAIRAILAYSYKPLRLISLFGLFIFTFSIFFLVSVLFYAIFLSATSIMTLIIISLLLLIWGSVGLILGLMSEYLGLIYEEVKSRPTYLISEIY